MPASCRSSGYPLRYEKQRSFRGPKPVGELRSLEVPIDIIIPEPNTWREIVAAVSQRPERRIAVQEYGRLNTPLHTALAALGAKVTPVFPLPLGTPR